MTDWLVECLEPLRNSSNDDKLCYEMFCKHFITSGASQFDDDILYFVDEDSEADPNLVVRRMPADGNMPKIDFKPAWRETLALNVITHMDFTLLVELLSIDGTVKMNSSVPVYPSPIDHNVFSAEKKCTEKIVFPHIIIPVPDASIENKRLPVQRDDKLRITLHAGGKSIYKDELAFGMISSEFCRAYRKHRTVKPDLDADQNITFKRANSGKIVVNAAPFFMEGYKMGVRSAIYSLFLKRFPQTPDRFICKTVSVTLHWSDIISALY